MATDNHIPEAQRDQVDAYIRATFPQHVELMAEIARGWWGAYLEYGAGWLYWRRRYDGLELYGPTLARELNISQDTLHSSMLALAHTGLMTVQVTYDIRHQVDPLYTVEPLSFELLIGLCIGTDNENYREYRAHLNDLLKHAD